MNGSAPTTTVDSPARPGWSRQRWLWIIGLAILAHLILIFIFGTKQPVAPRPISLVPQLQWATAPGELISLGDPTLFALPHLHDFASAVWVRDSVVVSNSFRWTEPPRFLNLSGTNLGRSFSEFMRTNLPPQILLKFKPEPEAIEPLLTGPDDQMTNSFLKFDAQLAARSVLSPPSVPNIAYNDVLPPSTVQVLVDTSGMVLSCVVLESSTLDEADLQALKLARSLRFAPASRLAKGEVTFVWRTIPITSTNTP